MVFRNFLLLLFATAHLSCSIPTFIAISNYSDEKIEIIFYLKKKLNEDFFTDKVLSEESELKSEEEYNLFKIKKFFQNWKSIPARNILNEKYSVNSKTLTKEEIKYDLKNNKTILIVDPYTAIVLFEGHNFENPISDYISKINFEHKKGSMSFEKEYITFPFSYEDKCKCLIWKIY
ncbi:hypothetical protein [Leptospira mtsangambouensis]|uniref:hypothetical protein n=1 Tax=Leptospira mtsangambouensis TaxID=2484912 RepID=UPI001EEA7B8A|nr:hypothetical protein [Leptospira mtsangambouensis]MCG6142728.1 hypothetical protein [Leptospira mtsangambouensis]